MVDVRGLSDSHLAFNLFTIKIYGNEITEAQDPRGRWRQMGPTSGGGGSTEEVSEGRVERRRPCWEKTTERLTLAESVTEREKVERKRSGI